MTQDYRILELEIKILAQIAFHVPQFSYALQKWQTGTKWIKKFSKEVKVIENGKDALEPHFFSEFINALPDNENFWKGLCDSEIKLEYFLIQFHKDSINCLTKDFQCPACSTFALIDDYPGKPLAYTVSGQITSDWFEQKLRNPLNIQSTPISLILYISKKHLAIECGEKLLNLEIPTKTNNFIKYELRIIICKHREKNVPGLFNISETLNQWTLISPTERNVCFSQISEIFENYYPDYLIYEKIKNQDVYLRSLNFFQFIFMNFFYVDYFFYIIEKKKSSSWLETLIDSFKELITLKNETDSEEIPVELEETCKNIAKKYLKYSKLGFSSESNDMNSFEPLFEEMLEEMCLIDHIQSPDSCTFCSNFKFEATYSGVPLTKTIISLSSEDLISLSNETNIILCFSKFPEILIFFLKGAQAHSAQILKCINILQFKEKVGKGIVKYSLSSVIFINGNSFRTLCFIQNSLKWVLFYDDQGQRPLFSDFSEAFIHLSGFLPLIFIYEKGLKSNFFNTSTKGTVPLRCINDIQNLCYINSAVQALFNINSFRKDITNWESDVDWAVQLKNIFSRESNSKKRGICTYDFENFRLQYKISTKYEFTLPINKKGSACKFLNHLLKNIHKFSKNCSEINLCPACKNFNIIGDFWIESQVIKREIKQIKSSHLTQHMMSENYKLSSDILTIFEKKVFHYNISKPPLILYIELSSLYTCRDEIKTKDIKDYLRDNEVILYENKGIVHKYLAKSIILFGNKHFKSLLYSRTHQQWMYISDNLSEPIYLKLSDFDITNKSIVVNAVLYYLVLTDKDILSYLKNFCIALFSIGRFRKSFKKYAESDKSLKIRKKLDEFLENEEKPDFSMFDKEFLKGFKKDWELVNVDDVFKALISMLLHSKDKECLCNCVACVVFSNKKEYSLNEIKVVTNKIQSSSQIEEIKNQFFISNNNFQYFLTETEDIQKIFENIKKELKEEQLNPNEKVFQSSFKPNKTLKKPAKIITIALTNEKIQLDIASWKKMIEDKRFIVPTNSETVLTGFFTLKSSEFHFYKQKSIVLKSELGYSSVCITFSKSQTRCYSENASQDSTLLYFYEKKYIPCYVFYSKKPLNYVRTAIQTLYNIKTFRFNVLDFSFDCPWLSLLKNFFKNKKTINDHYNIYDFRVVFNENYHQPIKKNNIEKGFYTIEWIISCIINRIHSDYNHIKEITECSCPSCRNFLIDGYLSTKNGKKHSLYITSIKNYINTDSTLSLKKRVLSYYFDQNLLFPLFYYLKSTPLVLFYTLNYFGNENTTNEQLLTMLLKYLENNQTIQYKNKQVFADYKLQTIVFSITNKKDKFYIANCDENDKWTINNQKASLELENIFCFIAEKENNILDYFPSVLLYCKK